ncbi:MAG: hypothetical protein L6R38_006256 [Xanthoria sp. 2 TBL-2021]|nr:MAG: hypothetical protein L6R38_006256 [Xanthoria sp. 2 TBL-2021]
METEKFGTVAITVTFVATLLVTANYFFGPKYDPREPPVIHQKIPYIGHVIGLLQYGLRYFEVLSTKHPLPAFTLQTLGKRVYVVNSPDLIAAVQKNAKALSFNPFVSFMSPRVFDAGDEANAIIDDNIDGEKGQWGLLYDISRGMHNALAPSSSLDWMTKTMLTKLEEYIEPLGLAKGDLEMDLYKWVRKAITVASTEAVYGPKNPFNHDAGLEDAFWDFESDITMILFGIAPSITARKGYNARKRFIAGLSDYFKDNGPETGSDLIKARWEGNKKYGAEQHTAAFEIGNLIGVLINATPSFFWMLLHIYSRPTLLDQLRAEIAIATESTTTGSTTTQSIIVSKLKEHCPLLLSTYQETLRLQTHNTSSRWVTKDTVIADQYLLKAGNSFNPHRFMKIEKKSKEKSQKQHPASFRTFGGGATLCPGRHFATAELCAATAMMVMRFDLEPVNNGGVWVIPRYKYGRVASAVPPPDSDVKVKIKTRKGMEDVRWRFGFEGSVSKFEVFGG